MAISETVGSHRNSKIRALFAHESNGPAAPAIRTTPRHIYIIYYALFTQISRRPRGHAEGDWLAFCRRLVCTHPCRISPESRPQDSAPDGGIRNCRFVSPALARERRRLH